MEKRIIITIAHCYIRIDYEGGVSELEKAGAGEMLKKGALKRIFKGEDKKEPNTDPEIHQMD